MLRRTLKSIVLGVPPIRRIYDENAALRQRIDENSVLKQKCNDALTENIRLKEQLESLPTTTQRMSSPSEFSRLVFPFGRDPASGKSAPDISHFLVTSSGHCGSIWLAGSLNFHEEVCANVGLGHPLQQFNRYALNKDLQYMVEYAREEFIRYGFPAPTGYVPSVLGVGISMNRDLWRLPWYIFDELELVPTPQRFKALGNVHGLVLAHVFPAWLSDLELFCGRNVALMDLIRHPVSRTESAINATMVNLAEREPHTSDYIKANAPKCIGIERKYGIDLSEPRARAAFIVYHMTQQNDAWAKEILDYPDVYRILFERLQSEPEYYAAVFFNLTQGKLIADQPHLDLVFASENLGSGRQSTSNKVRTLGAKEQYDRWSHWEKEEFFQAAQRLNLPRLYFPFGYDFSFVKRGEGRAGSWFSEMFL